MLEKYYLVETATNGTKTTREFETEQEAYLYIDAIRKDCNKITLKRNACCLLGSFPCIWTDCTLLNIG